jgi:hypothetical protein
MEIILEVTSKDRLMVGYAISELSDLLQLVVYLLPKLTYCFTLLKIRKNSQQMGPP